jgi:hypothetical protein
MERVVSALVVSEGHVDAFIQGRLAGMYAEPDRTVFPYSPIRFSGSGQSIVLLCQHTHAWYLCTVHLSMSLPVLTPHDIIVSSACNNFANAMLHTAPLSSSSRQSFPICAPLSRSDSRDKPLLESVIHSTGSYTTTR